MKIKISCLFLGFFDSVYAGLKDFNARAKVYKKEEIPKHFHYNNNGRIPPILILPDDGWFLLNNTHDRLYESKPYCFLTDERFC